MSGDEPIELILSKLDEELLALERAMAQVARSRGGAAQRRETVPYLASQTEPPPESGVRNGRRVADEEPPATVLERPRRTTGTRPVAPHLRDADTVPAMPAVEAPPPQSTSARDEGGRYTIVAPFGAPRARKR